MKHKEKEIQKLAAEVYSMALQAIIEAAAEYYSLGLTYNGITFENIQDFKFVSYTEE